MTIDYRVGGRMPLDDTGVGLALLAGEPAVFTARYLAGRDPIRAERLRRSLEDFRRLSVAVHHRPRPAPVTSVAAPIWNGFDRTVAAVSVVVPAGAARPQAYTQVVRSTALAISRAVGHRPRGRAGVDRGSR